MRTCIKCQLPKEKYRNGARKCNDCVNEEHRQSRAAKKIYDQTMFNVDVEMAFYNPGECKPFNYDIKIFKAA